MIDLERLCQLRRQVEATPLVGEEKMSIHEWPRAYHDYRDALQESAPMLLEAAAVLAEIEKMRDELPPEDAGENSGTLWALHNNARFVLGEAERRAATEET